MEWLAASAGAATVSAHSAFKYNRENFKYDREMRQKCEFQVLEFRAKQAGMWRQDVSDVIALTERKMESYLIVNTIQLGMVLVLFTEGRLEAGTPQWLLRFYMISLGAAFMYLLLSIWLAMHAAVVAQTSGTRLLTQFVRLPIPTWKHIDKMRTYGASFETMGKNMVRIPFVSAAPSAPKSTWNEAGDGAWASRSCATPHPRESASTSPRHKAKSEKFSGADAFHWRTSAVEAEHGIDDNHFDVWGLEQTGHQIGELKEADVEQRPHIRMLRDEAIHWQCNDMFSRVAMSFGSNNLIYAIVYYCFGYISVQDGAPMPAVCVAAVMMSVSMVLVHLDFRCTTKELRRAYVLLLIGPCCMGVVCFLLANRSSNFEAYSRVLLCIGYISHAGWLYWALMALGIKKYDFNGAWIPTQFRAVSFLDVFGWYDEHRQADIAAKEGKIVRTVTDECLQFNRYRRGSQPPLSLDAAAEVAAAGLRGPEFVESHHVPDLLGLSNPVKVQAAPTAHVSPLKGSAQMQALRLPVQSRTESCESEPPTPHAFESMKERLQGEFSVWQDEEVQSLLDAHDQERVSTLQREFHAAVGEPLHSSESESGAKPIFEGTGLSSSSSNSQASWVQLKGHTDVGVEMPYFYNADNGEVRSMSFDVDAQDSSTSPTCTFSKEIRPRTLSQTEEHVKQFCRKAAKVKARQAALTPLQEEVAHHKVEDAIASGFGDFYFDEHGEEPHGGYCTGKMFPDPSRETTTTEQSSQPASGKRVFIGHDAFHGPATDYGRVDIGKLPWKALQTSTWLLIALWLTGPLLSFSSVGGWMEYGFEPLQADGAMDASSDREIDPARVAAAALDSDMRGDLPALAEGLSIDVEWPRSHSFMPRSLSCDPTGTQLVVADDFGVYSAHLDDNEEPGNGDRKLRGASVASDDASSRRLAARFSRAPPCTAFEGDALKDIGVVCDGTIASECRVLVLHDNGARLTECPLGLQANFVPKLAGKLPAELPKRGLTLAKPVPRQATNVRPVVSWTISDDWLGVKSAKSEKVDSMAVNSECLASRSSHAFLPVGPGCLVVGTTSGRLVELRRHVIRLDELVPEMSMQHRHQSVGQGSLHVLPGGIVLALRRSVATVQAFDMHSGDVIGEWKLPTGISWIALCGGGNHLYVIGRKSHSKRRHVMLWRFPLPQELRETIRQIISSAKQEEGDAEAAPSEDEQEPDQLYEA